MRLTHRQKKLLVNVATPLLIALYSIYRIVSLEAFRRHGLSAWRNTGLQQFAKRILVVRLDTIGDVLLSEPAIRALKHAFPQARIDVLVGTAGKAVLAGNPSVDRFIVYDAPWHAAWRGRSIAWRAEAAKALGIVRGLRRSHYDLAVELRGDLRDIAFMAGAGAAVKVGSGWRGGGFMLDVDADVDVEDHRVGFTLGIVGAVGAVTDHSSPKVWLCQADRETARSFLPDEDARYIAMHLGAGFASKCLPVKKFAEVAGKLAETSERGERRFVVIGGSDDGELVEQFKGSFSGSFVDLVGKLSLSETASVLEKCELFVGNDSGPMHIAAAVGTPVVAFFGPSEPHKYRPYMVKHKLLEISLPCRPCDHVHCSQPENICLTGIEVANIVAAAEELLKTHQTVCERER